MNESNAIHPSGWKEAVGYSHAMSAPAGRIVFTAGQIGWNPTSCEFESDDFAAQTAQALRNVVAVLKAADATPAHLVRLTWYITDREGYLGARKEIGAAYREIVGRRFPPMSIIIVRALLDERAQVEIEATAVVPA